MKRKRNGRMTTIKRRKEAGRVEDRKSVKRTRWRERNMRTESGRWRTRRTIKSRKRKRSKTMRGSSYFAGINQDCPEDRDHSASELGFNRELICDQT